MLTVPAFVATTIDQLHPAVNSEYLLHVMDTKCSLPCPQQHTTKPYHETTLFLQNCPIFIRYLYVP
jgi:hypothetical protein